jgi:phage terminase small subunit
LSSALTVKQERFATAYIETGNASEAYRQAYDAGSMNDNTIGKAANELLKNPKVAERIDELRSEHRERHKITVDRISEELAAIAFADPRDYYKWDANGVTVKDSTELTEAQRRAIAVVEQTVTEAGGTIRVRPYNKIDALEKLARLHGMYKDGNGDTPPGNVTNITRIERLIVYPSNPDAGGVPAPAGEPPVQGSKGRSR